LWVDPVPEFVVGPAGAGFSPIDISGDILPGRDA
jgi:hypothetical protein